MTQKKNLHRLTDIASILLDQRLAKLQACAAERNMSLRQLQGLAPKASEGDDPIAQAMTLMRYETWADTRRREINLSLARQTAAWLEARAEAKGAFGRADVLKRIVKMQDKARKKSL
jgi:hypothetical protein